MELSKQVTRKGHPAWNKGLKYEIGNRGGGYHAVHKWLIRYFGKAVCCLNPRCKGKSKTYQWAKLKGKKYEFKIDNFVQMCASCHHSYDQTKEGIERMRNSKKGKRLSREHRELISKSMKGKNIGNTNAKKYGIK